MACLVLPWLMPFAPGPSPAAVPLMTAWLCSALALGLGVWRDPQLVARAWLAAALLGAVFGLLQYFGLTGWAGSLINYTEPGTAFANLRQRNQFASLLSIGTLAALYLWRRGLPSLQVLGSVCVLAIANAASTSRTGLLQLVLIALLSLAWARADRWRVAQMCIAALAAYALSMLLLPWLLNVFTGIAAPGLLDRVSSGASCTSRMVLWSNVLELIQERPLGGWGIGELDYAHFVHLYAGERFCDILDNAHNLPLHVAVELGVPAALALLIAVALAIVRLQPWREADPVRQLAWGVLVMLAVHSLLEYPLWYGPFQLALILSVLLLWRRAAAPAPDAWRGAGQVLAFIAVPMALAYAAWDYHRISQLYVQPEDRSPAYREGTLEKASRSILFSRQVRFAELGITPLTLGNARDMHALAQDMLHFSPEPKVIEAVIDSAVVLHDESTALWTMARYRAAFPADYDAWIKRSLLSGKGQ